MEKTPDQLNLIFQQGLSLRQKVAKKKSHILRFSEIFKKAFPPNINYPKPYFQTLNY